MTLPASPNSINLGAVNTELNRPSTQSINMGDGGVRGLAGVASGQISMSQLRGKSSLSFSPGGGTTSPGQYVNAVGPSTAAVTITASKDVTWYHGGAGGSTTVTVNSGGTASSITFRLNARRVGSVFQNAQASWNLSAVVDGKTFYWVIQLEVGTE